MVVGQESHSTRPAAKQWALFSCSSSALQAKLRGNAGGDLKREEGVGMPAGSRPREPSRVELVQGFPFLFQTGYNCVFCNVLLLG